MDVKITFGVDLESVPSRIADSVDKSGIEEVVDTLSVIAKLLRLSNDNSDVALDLIKQARIKMGSLDRVLLDSQMILTGYLSAKNKAESVTQESEMETEDAS